jgi:hypothetical protein
MADGTGQPQNGQVRSAVINMPTSADLLGQQKPRAYRAPFYPTAPFYSTDPNVGYQTRYYTTYLSPSEPDYAVGGTSTRRIPFDIPVRLIAINGAAVKTDDPQYLSGLNPLDMFMLNFQYTNGDKLSTNPALASTLVGTSQRPGELGGVGWTINGGATLLTEIIPLIPSLYISINFVCLEMRGPTNYTGG